jgi:hypothetical protein
MKSVVQKVEKEEESYAFKNRRAEIYFLTRQLVNPSLNEQGFGISSEHGELRRQLAILPLKYDDEGRIYLPPKNTDSKTKDSLVKILGRSPDQADALTCAVYAKNNPRRKKLKPLF